MDTSIAFTTRAHLPATKIKRKYKCKLCEHTTIYPKDHLLHRIQDHGHKIRIVECPLCLYACQYRQKLKRHLHLVHKTTFEQVDQGILTTSRDEKVNVDANSSVSMDEEDVDVDGGLDEFDERVVDGQASPSNFLKFNEFHAIVSQMVPYHGLSEEPNDLSFPESVKQLMKFLY